MNIVSSLISGRYMAEVLPIQRKTLSNQSINRNAVLWNHSNSLGPMFLYCQKFAGLLHYTQFKTINYFVKRWLERKFVS